MSTTSFTSGKVKFDFSLGTAAQPVPRDPDAPLHILVMGDFFGEARPADASPKPLRIDIDNFDQVMTAVHPRCRVLLRPRAAEFSFRNLEDFYPDQLLRAIAPAIEAEAQLNTEANQNLISRLMGDQPPPPPPAPPPKSPLDIAALLKSAVGPSVVMPSTADEAARAQAQFDQATALRAVLHDPAFQTLEANWRGVDLLVRNFGSEEQICLSLADCTFARFDAPGNEDLQATPLFQLLRKRSSDERFAIVLALYTFEPTPSHIHMLARTAKICAAQQAMFIAAASPGFAGRGSFAEGAACDVLAPETQDLWDNLRKLPEANRLALALPRFLLRQPYGAGGDIVDAFPFEEFGVEATHEHFLWGNPAILCGHALADAFLADGWAARTNGFAEVGDLPVYRFKQNGETKVMPCAEVWMPDTLSEQLSQRGLTPVQSIKGRDAVRVAGLRSLAANGAALTLK